MSQRVERQSAIKSCVLYANIRLPLSPRRGLQAQSMVCDFPEAVDLDRLPPEADLYVDKWYKYIHGAGRDTFLAHIMCFEPDSSGGRMAVTKAKEICLRNNQDYGNSSDDGTSPELRGLTDYKGHNGEINRGSLRVVKTWTGKDRPDNGKVGYPPYSSSVSGAAM